MGEQLAEVTGALGALTEALLESQGETLLLRKEIRNLREELGERR